MLGLIARTLLAASGAETPAPFDPALVPSAWASAETTASCDAAPISLFLSDGSMIIFEEGDGGLHAVGTWRIDGGDFILSYNGLPLPADGQAAAPQKLAILELTAERFVTRNQAGATRVRVRCEGLILPRGFE